MFDDVNDVPSTELLHVVFIEHVLLEHCSSRTHCLTPLPRDTQFDEPYDTNADCEADMLNVT